MEGEHIWSRDRLRALLNHPSDEVQSWAACRIMDSYPNMSDKMLAYLPQVVEIREILHGLGARLPASLPESLMVKLQPRATALDKVVQLL